MIIGVPLILAMISSGLPVNSKSMVANTRVSSRLLGYFRALLGWTAPHPFAVPWGTRKSTHFGEGFRGLGQGVKVIFASYLAVSIAAINL
jgi:hypothetical protein